MKKLVALLAVLSYVPFAHAAEGDWTHSGEFRLQYFNESDFDGNKNLDDNDQAFHQRTKVGTTVRAGEKMTFNFGLLHNAEWGSNATQTPDNFAAENALMVHEANAVWQASDVMTMKFGRLAHQIADGSVVGLNSWENTPKAFDGAGLVYELEPVRLTGFGVTGAKGTTSANQYGRFWGIVADAKTLPAWLKMASLHYIMVKRDAGTYTGFGAVDKEDATRIGLTASGDAAGVDYKVTYAMYEGTEGENQGATKVDIDASMMDVEVGYSLPQVMNLRFFAGYHTDSGTKAGSTKNETYNPFHYNSYENAGRMDIVGWGNLTYLRAGATMSPTDDITVALEYFQFTKTEKDDNVYNAKHNGATLAGVTTDDEIGNEIDLTVTKKYTNNFATSVRYSQFEFGKIFGANDDTATQIYVDATLTF